MSRAYLGKVLVIEDDFLIASDIGYELSQLGAREVAVVCSVTQALDAVSGGEIDFATVDVRLAGEDCGEIVAALSQRQIPWVYITGYLEADFGGLVPAPWLTKPVTSAALAEAIAAFGTSRPVLERSM